MKDLLKSAKDKLTLKADQDDTRYGCEFSQESIDNAPPATLEPEEDE